MPVEVWLPTIYQVVVVADLLVYSCLKRVFGQL